MGRVAGGRVASRVYIPHTCMRRLARRVRARSAAHAARAAADACKERVRALCPRQMIYDIYFCPFLHTAPFSEGCFPAGLAGDAYRVCVCDSFVRYYLYHEESRGCLVWCAKLVCSAADAAGRSVTPTRRSRCGQRVRARAQAVPHANAVEPLRWLWHNASFGALVELKWCCSRETRAP